MKNKKLILLTLLTSLVSCSNIPVVDDKPKAGENITEALKISNFYNYYVHSNHETSQYFNRAIITPGDLLFRTTKRASIIGFPDGVYRQYYFKNIAPAKYDVYYFDDDLFGGSHNKLGDSYYDNYEFASDGKQIDTIPTLEDITRDFHVFDFNLLVDNYFTYKSSEGGVFYLNLESNITDENVRSRINDSILKDFFKVNLDGVENYMIDYLKVNVISDKIEKITYKLVDKENDKTISNELFYRYHVDSIQANTNSLINDVYFDTVENTLSFQLTNDKKWFVDGNHKISSIAFYRNYDYQKPDNNIPLVILEDENNVTARLLTLQTTLDDGDKYLIRVTVRRTDDKVEHYDYSATYKKVK